jgi:opacity protein-like surface antigen
MKNPLLCSALLAALMSVAGGAQAVLVSQGDGVFLDDVNNLLWYSDGTKRNFNSATSWAAGLTTGGLSAGSWSITTRDQFGLLAAAAGSTTSERNTTLDGFGVPYNSWTVDVQAVASQELNERYGRPGQPEYINRPQSNYIVINANFNVGNDGSSSIPNSLGSLAVASYASPAPEPETYALMLAGLAAVGFAARRRQVL